LVDDALDCVNLGLHLVELGLFLFEFLVHGIDVPLHGFFTTFGKKTASASPFWVALGEHEVLALFVCCFLGALVNKFEHSKVGTLGLTLASGNEDVVFVQINYWWCRTNLFLHQRWIRWIFACFNSLCTSTFNSSIS
jgi:hypothetical protein